VGALLVNAQRLQDNDDPRQGVRGGNCSKPFVQAAATISRAVGIVVVGAVLIFKRRAVCASFTTRHNVNL
jgi:hypothetical protein